MIRLLNKQEITKSKNDERAKEISEGLKISRKVDALRELSANEEAKLEKFRVESIAQINKDISELDDKKQKLIQEINVLQTKLDSLLPEMETERTALNELKLKLEKEKKDIEIKSEELDLKEIDIALALKNAKDDSKRAENHKELADSLHKEALKEKQEADSIIANSRVIEERTIHFKNEIEKNLQLKENDLLLKEKSIILQEEENKKLSQELAKEKIQVADQRDTLTRALDRIKQNRL